MCNHRWEYRYYTDIDTGYVFAIGVCYSCCKEVLMVCSCGDTLMVLSGYFCCPSCDCIGAIVWPPIRPNTNGVTCDVIDPPDESLGHAAA